MGFAQLRGALLTQLLRLLVSGATPTDPFRDALEVCRLTSSPQLLDFLDTLEEEELARLSSDVMGHYSLLSRHLGEMPSSWEPRTSVRAYQRLAGGNVILRDIVDVMVGTIASERASVALLDLTSSALGVSAEKAMRYHALVQTLRTGVAPLRTASFSSATGELWVLEVTSTLLQQSVRDVLDVLKRAVK
jgi:hypothetical protein